MTPIPNTIKFTFFDVPFPRRRRRRKRLTRGANVLLVRCPRRPDRADVFRGVLQRELSRRWSRSRGARKLGRPDGHDMYADMVVAAQSVVWVKLGFVRTLWRTSERRRPGRSSTCAETPGSAETARDASPSASRRGVPSRRSRCRRIRRRAHVSLCRLPSVSSVSTSAKVTYNSQLCTDFLKYFSQNQSRNR